MEGSPTRLPKFMEDLGLRTLDVVREAERIASEEGVESISRSHFHKLRQGRVSATAEKIYIVVAAVRSDDWHARQGHRPLLPPAGHPAAGQHSLGGVVAEAGAYSGILSPRDFR
jgi:hypothetical protein